MTARAVALALAALLVAAPAAAAPDGDVTWAVHISLAPTWFDPAETPSVITPFMMLYALHDAVVKPMPGQPMAPSLAESWTVSKDGLAYEFVLRKGVKFHNGDPVTAEDVKFSLERYRGGGASTLKARVAGVDIVDPQRVRIRLKQPWPDFMTFYGTPATGAAWVVPKKYVERVGDDGFKRAPVGAGPYRFVSFNPGVELVLEANEGYWRKPPSASSRATSSSSGRRRRTRTIRRARGSCWPRPATRAASTPATSPPTPSTRRPVRPSSTIFARWAFARSCGRSSARPSTRPTRKRASGTSCGKAARRPATRRPGSKPSSSRAASAPTAATRTSTASSASRPWRSTRSGGRRCCIASSSSCTSV